MAGNLRNRAKKRERKRVMQEREEMREECTLRNKRGQYRDKVERITYQIPSVHTEKENGKRHVANRASVRAQDGKTNAREKGKIREHICIREKSGEGIEDRDGYIGKIEEPRGTNTIKEANNVDKERRKRRTRRKNERTDDKNKRNQDSVWD